MNLKIELPNFNDSNISARVDQVCRYVYRLAEQLKYEFPNDEKKAIDANDITDNLQITKAIKKIVLSDVKDYVVDALSDVKDYVIESGTDGIWTYRKWQSGQAEFVGKVNINVSANTTSANITVNYPFPINNPYMFIQGGANGWNFSKPPYAQVGAESSGTIHIYPISNASTVTYTLFISVHGTWK